MHRLYLLSVWLLSRSKQIVNYLWFGLVISLFCMLEAEEPTIARYLELYRTFPDAFGPKGSWKQGEVELIENPQKMVQIQETMRQRLLKKGLSETEATARSRVGVIQEDAYWMWVRDAVTFPSGKEEIYNRFVHKKSLSDKYGSPVNGAATLIVFPDQKVVLNLVFRHATRSWEIELPRGGKDKNETLEEAACREAKEETGCIVTSLELLGILPFDTGSMTSFNAVFFAKVSEWGKTDQEEEEVIADHLLLSKNEIIAGLSKGTIEVFVNHQTIQAHCRDPLLSFAILVADARGLFH